VVDRFKFSEDGFIIRLPGLNEMVEDARELMSGVLDGLDRPMAGTLRSVIVAQEGFVVVKGLSRHTKGLGDTVFGFDFGAADATPGT